MLFAEFNFQIIQRIEYLESSRGGWDTAWPCPNGDLGLGFVGAWLAVPQTQRNDLMHFQIQWTSTGLLNHHSLSVDEQIFAFLGDSKIFDISSLFAH